ncbi:hypothetical protein OSTOST_04335 [Ostertagia ostertagi]
MAKIRRERWDDTWGPKRQVRNCNVAGHKDIWRLAHRHGLVQRRYRTAKRMAAAEAGESSDGKGPREEVLPSDEFDYHVEEVIDLTDDNDETPQAAPVFWQTMQRVDTAAIEAFQTFQEVPENGQENPETKPLPKEEPRSQFTIADALKEESEVVIINTTP